MSKLEDVHFIGIGGIGMSGLAKLLKEQGAVVTGSDVKDSALLQSLREMGIGIEIGHRESHIHTDQTVVFSSEIAFDNVELKSAREKALPLLHRSELLRRVTEKKRLLAVTGTHGKTTTSALLAHTLECGGVNPSFLIGGIVPNFGTNAHFGTGSDFVVEADESDGSFLNYKPESAIITNIDFDHLNFFKTKERLLECFSRFIDSVEGTLFYSADDPFLKTLVQKGLSFGFSDRADLKIVEALPRGWGSELTFTFQGKRYERVYLSLIGRHNALNAAAVFGLATVLGVSEEKIRSAFSTFRGVKRRQEKRGEVRAVLVLDDYAHHPTEIRETLRAVAEAVSPRRIVAVFQPHRPSRLQTTLGTFKGVFDLADKVILTDLYTAGEKEIEGVTTEALVQEVQICTYVPKEELISHLTATLRPHDVVLMMGAGDISDIAERLVTSLSQNPPKKLSIGVIQGGRSDEHAISLLSAGHVKASLDEELYETTLFTISPEGNWLSSDLFKKLEEIDLFFPVLHGPFGEDGTIQGFFEILGKPYAGPGFRGAAVAMDKALTKRIAEGASVATKPFLEISHEEWRFAREALLEKAKRALTLPLFVKPSHLGSSVGISKVTQQSELESAIDFAFQVDDRLILEEAVLSPREIEFALLGSGEPRVFPPGEVLTGGGFYDYDAKYSASCMKTTVDPILSQEKIEEGMELAKRVYRLIGCSGMARVDFFLDEEGKFWLNEVNPIPGFTAISLYPQILKRHGISSSECMNLLIQDGLRRGAQCRV